MNTHTAKGDAPSSSTFFFHVWAPTKYLWRQKNTWFHYKLTGKRKQRRRLRVCEQRVFRKKHTFSRTRWFKARSEGFANRRLCEQGTLRTGALRRTRVYANKGFVRTLGFVGLLLVWLNRRETNFGRGNANFRWVETDFQKTLRFRGELSTVT